MCIGIYLFIILLFQHLDAHYHIIIWMIVIFIIIWIWIFIGEEDQNLAAFLAIPQLLNTSTVKQTQKGQKGGPSSFRWKPSKVETSDAFIKHLKSDAEINQAIDLRNRSLNNKGATPQPYIIIVGESKKEIKSFLVVANQKMLYHRSNVMQAVDTCYKIIWTLNAVYAIDVYAIDSYAIWYFIQRGMYKMTSQFDKGSTSAESLLTDCNF